MGSQSSKSDDQKVKTAAGVGIGASLIITTAVCPPLGEAATAATLGTGVTAKVAGVLADDEDLEAAGDVLILGAEIGGVGNIGVKAIQGFTSSL